MEASGISPRKRYLPERQGHLSPLKQAQRALKREPATQSSNPKALPD